MAKTVWLLRQKIQTENLFSAYLSLKGLYIDNKEEIGVSKFTLDRWNWKNTFRKENIEIHKLVASSTREVVEYYNNIEELD